MKNIFLKFKIPSLKPKNKKSWQKGFLKLSKNLLVTYLIIIFAFSGISALFLFNPFGAKEAEAAWFNDNWAFRKTLTFTHNATVSSPTKVKFDIDTTAAPTDFQADCGDVRFTSPNGDILPYYYDAAGGACDTSSTDFYVLIPSIINGSNYIYIYYGNPNVVNGTVASNFSQSTTTPSGGAPSAGSEEKGPAPTAYWKFDEGQGTTVNDSTSNALTATIVNSSTSWKTEDNCISGKCLSNTLDGTGRAQVASNTKFQQTANVSWNVWTRISQVSSTNWPTIMAHSDTHVGYGIRYNKDTGIVYFERGTGACDGQNGNYGTNNFSSTSIADNTWHMLTMTQDGTNINLYFDGKFVSSTADAAFCSPSGLALYFVSTMGGLIDEAKIYNYALSADQIEANYNARSNPEGVAVAVATNTQNMPAALSNGLVGYWKMDETSWTVDCSTGSVLDSSGNTNNGRSCPNSTGPAGGAFGKFGNGGTLDGNDDMISVADSNSLDIGTNNLTMSVWFKRTGNANFGDGFTLMQKKGGSAASTGYKLALSNQGHCAATDGSANSKTLCFIVGDNTNYQVLQTTSTYSADSIWHHVVVVFDRNNSANNSIYVDGSKQAVTLTAAAAPLGTLASTNVFCFGMQGCSGTIGGFNGSLDEGRVYARALSGAEASQLYNWAPGPVGHWKLDEKTGTTGADASGYANNGTLGTTTALPTWTNGKYGGALSFDGTDTFFVSDSTSLSITNSFSLAGWIKVPNVTGFKPIVTKEGGGQTGYFLYLNGANVYTGYGNGAFASQTTSTSPITAGVWTHVASTFDGTTLRTYVNGSLLQSSTPGGSVGDHASNLGIGAAFDLSSTTNGVIDDVKVYNYPRTAGQIVEDMNAGHPAPGSPVSSTLGHWKFDEGYGTVANNYGSAGSAIPATLTNMDSPAVATSGWSSEGKYNKALSFNGSSSSGDYLNVPHNAALNITGDITMTAWIKKAADNDYGGIMAKTNGTSVYDYDFYICDSSCVQDSLAFYSDTTSPDVAYSTGTITGTDWHHVAVSRIGSTVTFYIDGKPSGSTTMTGSFAASTQPLKIGTDGDGSGISQFNGKIDEPKLYNQGLTADQIKLDMNRGQAQVMGALSTSSTPGNDNASARTAQSSASEYCVPGDSATCTGPVGEWKLDEKTGTAANDSSGNGFTGTLTNSPRWTNGKYNSAVDFNGSTQYITVADNSSLKPNFITVEYWMYLKTGSDTNARIIDKSDNTSSGYRFVKHQNTNDCGGVTANDKVSFQINTASLAMECINTASAVSQNAWTHITGTYDGATIAIYVNGILSNSRAAAGGNLTYTNSATLDFGSDGGVGFPYMGTLDTIRIFNYARTPAQIAWDYNKGGPVAWWKMDECQGTVINDASGNSNTGTLTIGGSGTNTTAGTCQTSGAWYNGATGKRNYSMDFDGTDDLINFTSTNVINVSAGSIAMWFKPSSTQNGSNYYLFSHPQTGTNSRIYINTNATGTSIKGRLGDGTTIADITITANTWHHLALEWNGTTAAMYVDGINRTTTATFNGLSSTISGSSIGNFTDGVQGYTGQIDEVKIFNYALTPTQVMTLYNDGAYRTGPVTGAP
jgi:hypothetical protein